MAGKVAHNHHPESDSWVVFCVWVGWSLFVAIGCCGVKFVSHKGTKIKKEKRICSKGSLEANSFENRLKDLIIMPIFDKKDKKTATFQKSMLKYCNYILPCIYDLDIPSDNNGSERAIRTIKVKQKVSGQFKTGQHAFCIIRSVIDTLIKQKLEVFPTLLQIIKLQPV